MAFSFLLKVGKVLDFLQSLGSEFQILAPLYAKLFCPNFVFIQLEVSCVLCFCRVVVTMVVSI